MPNESIVFDPEVDKRALDKEAQAVDDRFEQSGQINPEIGEVQGEFGLDGVGGIGGGRDMGGGGMGRAGAAAGLASRIPKPIAGVTAAAALPVALAGGVGLGMLSAMQGASARLQTSTNLLGQAWNNVWRPLGDRVDDLFIRDLAQDIVNATQGFEETLRGTFDEGLIPDRDGAADRVRAFSELTSALPGVFGDFMTGFLDTAADVIDGTFSWPSLPSFDWPSLPEFIQLAETPKLPVAVSPTIRLAGTPDV